MSFALLLPFIRLSQDPLYFFQGTLQPESFLIYPWLVISQPVDPALPSASSFQILSSFPHLP